jgi:diguanylate cyclase (GGDEF)-like protein
MFTEEFRKLLAQASRRQGRFALLLLDLDQFKQVNDSLGHDAGDSLLTEAGKRFKAAVRDADFVARLGGDEFAILLAESHDVEAIEKVCLRIIEAFVVPIAFNSHAVHASPSIGAALYPDHGTTQESLFKSADVALYAAKRAGRNTWRAYDVKLDT